MLKIRFYQWKMNVFIHQVFNKVYNRKITMIQDICCKLRFKLRFWNLLLSYELVEITKNNRSLSVELLA